jgi:hypothetical protein
MELVLRSPEGIRTLVADLRSQSPRPLDDGALVHLFTAVVLFCLGYCAGVPGLEPRLTEPESAGLPITPYPKRFTSFVGRSLPYRSE